jgi:hypothetical protein
MNVVVAAMPDHAEDPKKTAVHPSSVKRDKESEKSFQ